MTHPATATPEFDLAVFWQKYRKAITATVVGVALLGAGGWFWMASQRLKENRAEVALNAAERTFYSGNPQLAIADLNRVIQRYAGTPAGARAALLIAKAHYGAGQVADGIARLEAAAGSRASKPYRGAIYALIGGGLENQGKFDEAATAFGRASAEAPTELDRDLYKADQARALASAGKRDAAIAIWQALAADEASPMAGEARLRIGELSASAAGPG